MGPNTKRNNHVPRIDHANVCIGTDPKQMSHLLRMVPLLLPHWRRGQVSHDGHQRYGEQCRLRQNFNKRRPPPSGPQSDQRLLNAKLGPIFQPGSFNSPSLLLSWKRKSTLLGPCQTIDLPHLFCHFRR